MNIWAIIQKAPWLAIGAPLGTLGTQIDKPWSTAAFVACAFCTILAGIFHVNERRDRCDLPPNDGAGA